MGWREEGGKISLLFIEVVFEIKGKSKKILRNRENKTVHKF